MGVRNALLSEHIHTNLTGALAVLANKVFPVVGFDLGHTLFGLDVGESVGLGFKLLASTSALLACSN
jgi:hypothetical protein